MGNKWWKARCDSKARRILTCAYWILHPFLLPPLHPFPPSFSLFLSVVPIVLTIPPFPIFLCAVNVLLMCSSLWIRERMCDSQPGNFLRLLGNMLSLRWGKGWLKIQSPRISRGFRSVCFASGEQKEGRWQEDGQHSLNFREEEDAVSQQTSVFMAKKKNQKTQTVWRMFLGSEVVGKGGWFNEHAAGAHLKRCSHERESCCYIIHRLCLVY